MNNQARNVLHPMFGNFRDFTVHSTAWGIRSSNQLLPMPKATRSKSNFVTILSPAGNSSLLFIDDVDIAEKHSLNKKMDKRKKQKLEGFFGAWKQDRWAKDVLEVLPVRCVQTSIPLHCTIPVGIKAHGKVMKAKQDTNGTPLQVPLRPINLPLPCNCKCVNGERCVIVEMYVFLNLGSYCTLCTEALLK